MESSTAQSATSLVFRLRFSSGTTRSVALAESAYGFCPGHPRGNQAERCTSCSRCPERSLSCMRQNGRDPQPHHRSESHDLDTPRQSRSARLGRPAACASPAERCRTFVPSSSLAHNPCSRSTTSWFARDYCQTDHIRDDISGPLKYTRRTDFRRDTCGAEIPHTSHMADSHAVYARPQLARHDAVSCTAASRPCMTRTVSLGALCVGHTLPMFHMVVVRASTDMITSDAGAVL